MNKLDRLIAFGDLESDVHDLANMAGVLADRLEQMFGSGDHRDFFNKTPCSYYFPEQQVERTTFAAYHLQGMARNFVGKFLAALERGHQRPADQDKAAA